MCIMVDQLPNGEPLYLYRYAMAYVKLMESRSLTHSRGYRNGFGAAQITSITRSAVIAVRP